MADKHPLEVLKDIYEDSVKKADANGLSEIYKANTEALFKELPYSIEDIEYLDGYFVFGFGTNSVVHFHIKECPGWKFGIWWGMKGTDATGEFFTQYEECIDKFKPSASMINTVFTPSDLSEVISIINNIIEHPAKAFCYDVYYDKEMTDEEANKKFEEYKIRDKIVKEFTAYANKRVYDLVVEKILPLCNNAEIDIDGCRFPLYSIVVPLEDNLELFPEGAGWYEWDESEFAEIKALGDVLEKEAKEKGIWWGLPIRNDFYVYSKKA